MDTRASHREEQDIVGAVGQWRRGSVGNSDHPRAGVSGVAGQLDGIEGVRLDRYDDDHVFPRQGIPDAGRRVVAPLHEVPVAEVHGRNIVQVHGEQLRRVRADHEHAAGVGQSLDRPFQGVSIDTVEQGAEIAECGPLKAIESMVEPDVAGVCPGQAHSGLGALVGTAHSPRLLNEARIAHRSNRRVPGKQPKRSRLWLNDGSCVRLRAERADHVWSYDFVHHRTHDGRVFRTLNVLDEFTRESLAIRLRRKLSSADVVDVLADLFILRGIPAYVRSDNGPEFVAGAVRQWIAAVGDRTAFIEPGSPWENGYIESFNARLRDELLNGEIFYTLTEAQVLIEAWRRHYNAIRPHGSLGYRLPAPETIVMPSWPPGSAEKPSMH